MRIHPFALLLSFFSTLAFASEPDWVELKSGVEKRDFLKVQERLAEALDRKPSAELETRLRYFQVWTAFEAGQHQKVEELTATLLAKEHPLEEELRGFRADALFALGRLKEAEQENLKVLDGSPNFQLKQEALLRMARLRLREGNSVAALRMFRQLEKRARGTPGYPDVVLDLARAENKLGTRTAFCRWASKLYEKFPTFDPVEIWGPDLAQNQIDGEKTGCRNSIEDFRERVRALLWHGEDEKARAEVMEVATILAKDERGAADELRAWYLLQTGAPDEAYEILKALISARKQQVSFLRILASAAARAGDGGAAVAAYHRIWEMQPRSETGRKALYQSAVLSYQFQDYDGAGRRFREFIEKYPRSGLSRDARWNLAWISYLKGDYAGARERLAGLLRERSSAGRERNQYWMAMSYLREGKTEEARPLFAELAKDKDTTYYGIAARQRLTRMPMPAAPDMPVLQVYGPRSLGPARWAEALWPSETAPSKGFETTVREEAESEESLAAESEAGAGAEGEDDEEPTSDIVSETGRSEIEAESPFKAPRISRRFERALALSRMGFPDRARWELYEVEQRTRARDELQSLIVAYQQAGQWHRSSYIAQVNFASVRSQGVEKARSLWESAYPKAYAAEVQPSAKTQRLAPEFIWAIMRTESRYRREAVSPVGALGLMQIMPGTGRRLASLQSDREYATAKLLEPTTAVRYGAYYLRRLMTEFGEQIPLSAAAYNAGPHRVHGWLLGFGHLDLDEFVEHIPFIETRDYVRKVVAAGVAYQSLYGGEDLKVDLSRPSPVAGRPERSKKEIWEP